MTELDSEEVRARQWSTLDLCEPDAFTLIVGAKDHQLGIQTAQLQKYCEAINVRLNVWRLGTDFEIVRQDWFSAELNKTGGILVRPDQHILTMVSSEATGEELISALSNHFGK